MTDLRGRQLLHADRMRIRRLELGLSQRELAKAAAVNYQVVRRVELGQGHANLHLRDLVNFAAALALAPADLLIAPSADPTSDSATILAALVETATRPRRVRPVELANALRWPVDRAKAALEVAGQALSGSGIALARSEAGVRLAAEAGLLTTRDRQQLNANQMPRRIWGSEAARLLGMIARDEFRGLERNANKRVSTALGQLESLDYVRRLTDGGYELTPRTAYSLGLTNRLSPVNRRQRARPEDNESSRPE